MVMMTPEMLDTFAADISKNVRLEHANPVNITRDEAADIVFQNMDMSDEDIRRLADAIYDFVKKAPSCNALAYVFPQVTYTVVYMVTLVMTKLAQMAEEIRDLE